MNKRVGLVGEDPNDTSSVKNLLLQRFDKNISYIQLLNNIRGHQLDNARTKHSLQIECKIKQPDIIIFIRDADGICTHENAIQKCNSWHTNLSGVVKTKNILLLNIYELEVLIFADIEVFNKKYNTSIKDNRDVTFIKEPKEELKRKTSKLNKKYFESDCPELFKLLRIDNVIKNCSYFREFITKFSELVS